MIDGDPRRWLIVGRASSWDESRAACQYFALRQNFIFRDLLSQFFRTHKDDVSWTQVQLPLPANWNGRSLAEGGGGSEGSIPHRHGHQESGSAGSNFGITHRLCRGQPGRRPSGNVQAGHGRNRPALLIDVLVVRGKAGAFILGMAAYSITLDRDSAQE